MGEADTKPKLLSRAVKAVGRLLGPSTRPGRAFVFVEKNMTRAFDRLGQNATYLDVVGRAMNQGFRTHARANSMQEGMLHAMRLPTTSEVDALRRDVRSLHDQMEALSTQLEVVLESLEKKPARDAKEDSQ